MLKDSAELWCKCFFTTLEGYDTINNPPRMGFKKAYACTELVMVVRTLMEKRTEWNMETPVAQIDLARAYGSISHVAILRAMRHRSVPDVSALAYISETRRARMAFGHAEWSTARVQAGFGIRQGCSVAPVVFRSIRVGCMQELHDSITRIAWADDT